MTNFYTIRLYTYIVQSRVTKQKLHWFNYLPSLFIKHIVGGDAFCVYNYHKKLVYFKAESWVIYSKDNHGQYIYQVRTTIYNWIYSYWIFFRTDESIDKWTILRYNYKSCLSAAIIAYHRGNSGMKIQSCRIIECINISNSHIDFSHYLSRFLFFLWLHFPI
jgi:hypothetical protein